MDARQIDAFHDECARLCDQTLAKESWSPLAKLLGVFAKKEAEEGRLGADAKKLEKAITGTTVVTNTAKKVLSPLAPLFLNKSSAANTSTLELRLTPRGLGVHDKRTGEKNRPLAYSHGVAGGAVGGAGISATHRALSGMSIPKGVREISKGRPESYVKGFSKAVDKKKLLKSPLAALISPKAGLLSALKTKVLLRRGAKGALGGAIAGAGLKALHNVGSYELSKGLAGDTKKKKKKEKKGWVRPGGDLEADTAKKVLKPLAPLLLDKQASVKKKRTSGAVGMLRDTAIGTGASAATWAALDARSSLRGARSSESYHALEDFARKAEETATKAGYKGPAAAHVENINKFRFGRHRSTSPNDKEIRKFLKYHKVRVPSALPRALKNMGSTAIAASAMALPAAATLAYLSKRRQGRRKTAERKDLSGKQFKTFLKALVPVAAGTALGTGAGLLTRRMIMTLTKAPKATPYRRAMANVAGTALGGLAAVGGHMATKRQQQVHKLVEKAGK